MQTSPVTYFCHEWWLSWGRNGSLRTHCRSSTWLDLNQWVRGGWERFHLSPAATQTRVPWPCSTFRVRCATCWATRCPSPPFCGWSRVCQWGWSGPGRRTKPLAPSRRCDRTTATSSRAQADTETRVCSLHPYPTLLLMSSGSLPSPCFRGWRPLARRGQVGFR